MLSFGRIRTCSPVGELPARPLCEKARCSGYSPNRRIGQRNRRMVLRIFASAWDDPFCIHLSTSCIGSGLILFPADHNPQTTKIKPKPIQEVYRSKKKGSSHATTKIRKT